MQSVDDHPKSARRIPITTMKLPAEIRPRVEGDEVEDFVLNSTSCAEQMRADICDLKSAIGQTMARIEQSKQRLIESDRLIDALTGFNCLRRYPE